jgi:hypothetical protein
MGIRNIEALIGDPVDRTTDLNPNCARCGRHKGISFHYTNQHDEAVELEKKNKRI